ncbi:hypothetical protein JHK86_004491 [Glycine max]|nr:hypothetical protein JHK86_004491 [Glycine max]
MALKYGTFSDNLCKKLPTTLEELRARTARFIQMEEMTRFKEKIAKVKKVVVPKLQMIACTSLTSNPGELISSITISSGMGLMGTAHIVLKLMKVESVLICGLSRLFNGTLYLNLRNQLPSVTSLSLSKSERLTSLKKYLACRVALKKLTL